MKELPGALLIHDTNAFSVMVEEMERSGWEQGVNLWAFTSGVDVFRKRAVWSNKITSVVIHKDQASEGVDALTILRRIAQTEDLMTFPYVLMVLSGEATEKGVSDRVVNVFCADMLWDLTTWSVSSAVNALADPYTTLQKAANEGFQRGQNVIWEGRVASPSYICFAGRDY